MMRTETRPKTERLPGPRTVITAIVMMWLWQAALALVATGAGSFLVKAAFRADPSGDDGLWHAGSHMLLAFLAHDANGVRAAIDMAAVVLIAGSALTLVPMAVLMLAVEPRETRRVRRTVTVAWLLGRSLRHFPALSILMVLFTFAEAAALGAAWIVVPVVARMAHVRYGEARADQLGILAGTLCIAGALWLVVLHDLSRAGVIRVGGSAWRGLEAGFVALCQAPAVLMFAWAWRAVASLAPIALGAALASSVGNRGGLALGGLALAHQAVALARVAVRASWLSVALRAIPRSPRVRRGEITRLSEAEDHDRSARTDAPASPTLGRGA